MKWFILLSNQISMAQATITNSVEKWSDEDVREVRHHLEFFISTAHAEGRITAYQHDKLYQMTEALEPPTD